MMQKKWLTWIGLGAVAALMVGLAVSGAADILSLANLAQNRADLAAFVTAHFWQAVVIFVCLYIGSTALSVPGGAVLTMAGGFLFGVGLGGLLAVVSATAGAVGLFALAKTSLGEALRARAVGGLDKLRAGFNENAFSYLLFLRLVPLFPFWLVNLAPALLGVRLSVYTLATFIGIIPGTFAFAFFGSGLESILAKQQEVMTACVAAAGTDCGQDLSVGQLLTPEIILSLCVLGLVALLPMGLKRIKGTPI